METKALRGLVLGPRKKWFANPTLSGDDRADRRLLPKAVDADESRNRKRH
jgi:hypothetical protein